MKNRQGQQKIKDFGLTEVEEISQPIDNVGEFGKIDSTKIDQSLEKQDNGTIIIKDKYMSITLQPHTVELLKAMLKD